MNDITQAAEPAPSEEIADSTAIDENANTTPAPEHNFSVSDAVEKALNDAEEKAAEKADAEDAAAPDEKAAKAEKPVKDEAEDGEEEEAKKEAEERAEDGEKEEKSKREKPKREIVPPPEKMLPSAKEHWASVPHVVREDIARIHREHEGEVQHYRAVSDRYSQIAEYDQMAARNGINLRDSLAEVKRFEDLMHTNPLAGVNEILQRTAGINVMQFAEALAKMGPQGVQQQLQQHQMIQQAQQPPQVDPQVSRLQQQNEELQMQVTQQSLLTPFAAQNPRFNEEGIQVAIANLLKTDMIPRNLPAQQRLAEAYHMAVKLIPAAEDATGYVDEDEDEGSQRRADRAGKKSKATRGAPPLGTKSGNAKRVLSRDEALAQSLARAGVR